MSQLVTEPDSDDVLVDRLIQGLQEILIRLLVEDALSNPINTEIEQSRSIQIENTQDTLPNHQSVDDSDWYSVSSVSILDFEPSRALNSSYSTNSSFTMVYRTSWGSSDSLNSSFSWVSSGTLMSEDFENEIRPLLDHNNVNMLDEDSVFAFEMILEYNALMEDSLL